MHASEIPPQFADDTKIHAERADLVRLCTWLTGDSHLAEDIAQEALLIAWQQHDRLRDPTRHRQWLGSIARNLCRHWLRHQRRTYAQGAWTYDQQSTTALPNAGRRAEAFDLDVELERHELADLLDRALAMLTEAPAYPVGGFLADRLFEPLMAGDAPMARALGGAIGTGPGRGMGLLSIVMGLCLLGVALGGALHPRIRRLDDEVPDVVD